MSDPRPGVGHEAPSACCVELRCKSLYLRSDERPGWLRPSNLTHFWCGVTNTDLGPDDHAVTHDRCQQARSCFAGVELA